MSNSEKRIFLLPHQKAFLKSKAMHTAIIGGYGSGKTEGGIYKLISISLQYNCDTAYYLPTYSLVEDVALKKMPIIFKRLGIEYSIRKKPYNITLSNGTSVMLRSMDNPDLIAGYEVGYSVIDEIDRMSRVRANDSFNSITARNRIKLDNRINSIDFVCTPEGFNFLHNFFVVNKSENRILIKAKTSDNPFLPAGYIDQLKETYSEQYLASYLNGEFVNLTSGSVYNDFNRDKNTTTIDLKSSTEQLHVGMDFNVTQMAGVVFNNDKVAIREFVNVFDTLQMCELLKKEFPNNPIIIYPDASGNQRNSAGSSDFEIIKKAGFRIQNAKKNPRVRDRINASNKHFRNNGLINIKNCPNLVASLEQQTYKNGEPDKTSGHDHINDAFGYFIINQPIVLTGSSSHNKTR